MTKRRASYIVLAAAAILGCGSSDAPQGETRPDGCPEIFASGFRNPWRWSFDRQTGALWVGDVGQGAREEVDRVVRGGNYGWRCFEGSIPLPAGLPCGAEPNLLPPVADYGRGQGNSITGGYVYRGSAIPSLAGRYVFGDFGSSRLWDIASNTAPTLQVTGGQVSGLSISSFGEGENAELYVVHYGGTLHQLGGTSGALSVSRVFPNLSFTQPVALLQAPGDSTRWFVVEQGGRVIVFDNDPGASATTVFLDIAARVSAGGETGLLGMAFHPGFPADPRVFVNYTAASAGLVTRVSEFRLAAGGTSLDASTERVRLVVRQPESNHNGGHIAFGPDGYLYIGLGDGGGANDVHGEIGNGQLMTTLLGKMLRIDVSAGSPYGIPPDNPFAGNALCGTPP